MKSNFSATKSLFDIPKDIIYLDGNSLGPPTTITSKKINTFINEKWAKLLIKGWNSDKWIDKPKNIGNRIATLIGAENDSVIVGDTLSIRTYQALHAAIKLKPKGKVILSDSGNFPSDLYIAQGLIESLNLSYELRIVEPHEVFDCITEEVAVLLLTEVDYRSSRKHNMLQLTTKAHTMGAITIWDLAHSTGVLSVKLQEANADFAVGCTYKYLNGGPGSPAFIYVAPKHQAKSENAIKGWLGHASPFNFTKQFQPSSGIDKMQIGTPPIIASTALEASLDIFDIVDIKDIGIETIKLTEFFIDQTHKHCPELKLISPTCSQKRGAHLAFAFTDGYALMQCLIEHGVIGDFRMPNLIRFGFNPLFIDQNDVSKALEILFDIMQNKKWDKPEFKVKSYVT
ncbi:MAG: kynureninase [Paracoccaceae bacterium]|nr:kynureninase [Paracoccaceae bacterium]